MNPYDTMWLPKEQPKHFDTVILVPNVKRQGIKEIQKKEHSNMWIWIAVGLILLFLIWSKLTRRL